MNQKSKKDPKLILILTMKLLYTYFWKTLPVGALIWLTPIWLIWAQIARPTSNHLKKPGKLRRFHGSFEKGRCLEHISKWLQVDLFKAFLVLCHWVLCSCFFSLKTFQLCFCNAALENKNWLGEKFSACATGFGNCFCTQLCFAVRTWMKQRNVPSEPKPDSECPSRKVIFRNRTKCKTSAKGKFWGKSCATFPLSGSNSIGNCDKSQADLMFPGKHM